MHEKPGFHFGSCTEDPRDPGPRVQLSYRGGALRIRKDIFDAFVADYVGLSKKEEPKKKPAPKVEALPEKVEAKAPANKKVTKKKVAKKVTKKKVIKNAK
jgi:hypothetical protein